MADRLTEKKENRSDDYRIPIVTPDRNQSRNAEDRRQNEFNPRDYIANTSWSNPFSFLRQTEPPKTTTTTTSSTTTTTTTANRRRRRSKMNDTEKASDTTATVLKEEMRWNKKANKTPTILEVLEFKEQDIHYRREEV